MIEMTQIGKATGTADIQDIHICLHQQIYRIVQPLLIDILCRGHAEVMFHRTAQMIGRTGGKTAHPGVAFLHVFELLHLRHQAGQPGWDLLRQFRVIFEKVFLKEYGEDALNMVFGVQRARALQIVSRFFHESDHTLKAASVKVDRGRKFRGGEKGEFFRVVKEETDRTEDLLGEPEIELVKIF